MYAAVEDGKIAASPLGRKFVRNLRLKVPRSNQPYTDVELAQLWAKMETAFDWDDLDLTGKRLEIRRTWDPVDGAKLPKDNEPRTVT